MSRQEECRYTKEHEWVYPDGATAVVGITDFAQKELGDIVYVDIAAGSDVDSGAEIGSVESVKAVAEVYAPISGEVVEVNGSLEARPEIVNQDPMGEGWLVRMRPRDPSQIEQLMSLADYEKYLEEESA